jgi:hypothetical protein
MTFLAENAKPRESAPRVALAFAVAIFADLLQFPLTALTATGLFSIPAELADFVLDSVVMVALSRLIGFHWVLLPSLLVELVPGLDLIPTWTGCVAYVVWQRKRKSPPAPPPPAAEGKVIDV